MHSVVIGVDAGGTKTVAALARNGEIVRRVEGPAANVTTLGPHDAADTILRAVREAADGERPQAIHVGAAGAGRETAARELAELIAAGFPKARVTVGDDAEPALRSVVPSGAGIVLIAGTGSIALAVDGEGRVHRAGGLGHLVGDEGSAVWIGLEAIRLLGRVYDGRARKDETSDLVARHLDAPDRGTLIAAVYEGGFNPGRAAGLAPSVVAFAGKGNRASSRIVTAAAQHLGDLVVAVADAAGLAETAAPIALAGGLLRADNFLTTLLRDRLQAALAAAPVVRAEDPVLGAVRLAAGERPLAGGLRNAQDTWENET
ncbi:MAG: hypothetical protein JO263_06935 [Candidatus Eremiobacteraeota bacterium]|nr:hypothetical protein [Candidatus Eremiobacteraeota bacterium]